MIRRPPRSTRTDTLFPYTTLCRSAYAGCGAAWTSAWPLLLLAFLAQDDRVGVLHAVALVGRGRTVAADLRRHLADLLAIGAGDGDGGRLLALDGDAFRDRIGDVVAEAELQVQGAALHRRTIADAVDLQLLLEAFGDARHHVLNARAGRAPHGARLLAVIGRLHPDLAVGLADLHVPGRPEIQAAQLALRRDQAALDGDLDAGRHIDGVFSNTRHTQFLT